MLKVLGLMVMMCCASLAQTAPAKAGADPWSATKFLEGTWEANTGGAQGVATSGVYTFARELDGKVLARHSSNDPGCKAPAEFDCKHGDLLYVYLDAPGQPLRGIYFDNEGHVLHYTVSAPSPTSVVFVSEPGYGPQLRLMYELKDGVMYGKFQVLAPGATEWKSYLEWSGKRR